MAGSVIKGGEDGEIVAIGQSEVGVGHATKLKAKAGVSKHWVRATTRQSVLTGEFILLR